MRWCCFIVVSCSVYSDRWFIGGIISVCCDTVHPRPTKTRYIIQITMSKTSQKAKQWREELTDLISLPITKIEFNIAERTRVDICHVLPHIWAFPHLCFNIFNNPPVSPRPPGALLLHSQSSSYGSVYRPQHISSHVTIRIIADHNEWILNQNMNCVMRSVV